MEAEDSPAVAGRVDRGGRPSPERDALPHVPPLPFAVFDEFGRGADDRVHAYAIAYAAAAQAAERERCASLCRGAIHAAAEIGNADAMRLISELHQRVAGPNVRHNALARQGESR